MSKKPLIIGTSLVALSLFVAGTAFAAGAGRGAGSGHVRGPQHSLIATLNTVSGTTLSVTAKGKNSSVVTIDASKAKIFLDGAPSDATQLKAGQKLIVMGVISGDGTSVAATSISINSGHAKPGNMLSGTVSAVSGNSITVSADSRARRNGNRGGANASSTPATVTATVGAHTLFRVPGVKNPTIADVSVGARVIIVGVDATTGTGTPYIVNVIEPRSAKR